jgi:hypothetical protein
MALVAAPFLILSATTQILIPDSTEKSCLILPTKTSFLPETKEAIGYFSFDVSSSTIPRRIF